VPSRFAPHTKPFSFTLPRELHAALERRARLEKLDVGDIVRRALWNYLDATEKLRVEREIHQREVHQTRGTISSLPDPEGEALLDAAKDALQQEGVLPRSEPKRATGAPSAPASPHKPIASPRPSPPPSPPRRAPKSP
jgi:hypothetical protein